MSVLSHVFFANAECQAITSSKTVFKFFEDLSNWFENQTVVIAKYQDTWRSDEWNMSWHVKLGERKEITPGNALDHVIKIN